MLAKIQSDSGAKLGTAMKVTKTKPMVHEVAKHCNTSAKKLPGIRGQDESLPEIAITIQVSKASTLKTIADKKYAVVVMVVEQPKTRSEQKFSLTRGGMGT